MAIVLPTASPSGLLWQSKTMDEAMELLGIEPAEREELKKRM